VNEKIRELFVLDNRERRTEVHADFVVQFLYSQDIHPTKLIEQRITTRSGHTISEMYSPPLPMSELPPFPLRKLAKIAAANSPLSRFRLPDGTSAIGAKPARARNRAGNAAPDKRSRVSRLEKRRKAAET
jgi:hypothetical protein